MRSLPASYNDRKSEAQLKQRQRMSLVHEFIRPFKRLLPLTFFPEKAGPSAYQTPLSYNLKYGIKGEYPNQSINKNLALLSKGDLPLPSDIVAFPLVGQVQNRQFSFC